MFGLSWMMSSFFEAMARFI
ncbi:hypothetical protein O5641_22295 [Escherichia coli]|nr:hypothetical protein [Escherichia coli]